LLYIELALVILYLHLCDIYVHFSLVISSIIVSNSALSRSQSNVYVKFVHEINERKLLCQNYQIPERFDSTRLDCIYMFQEPYTLFISRTVHIFDHAHINKSQYYTRSCYYNVIYETEWPLYIKLFKWRLFHHRLLITSCDL